MKVTNGAVVRQSRLSQIFLKIEKTKEDDTQLQIDFEFSKQKTVYFAYTFPFSYEQNEKFLQKLSNETKKMKGTFYNDQILIRSPQGRNIHLITLSSIDGMMEEQENIDNQYIFPQKLKSKRPKFTKQKKVVIVSARVHPAEAPSSHTFNGLIKFLLSKDARAYYLRKNFIFKLIPMLNPDGVSCGHYRMDLLGQNLNRFYQNPDPIMQPSAYAVKELGKYYFQQKLLCFYIDLHAHPQKKGNFIYGNAFQSLESQVQTQLFAKILSMNSIQFEYENSSFQQKHMTLKDKNEALTKEGCGRVVFQKQFELKYSYTMECGYTASATLNQIVSIDKANRKFEKHSVLHDQLDNIKSLYYNGGKKPVYFTIQAYEALGKNIAISILDLFAMNPASRIPNTPFRSLDGVRKQLMHRIQRASNPSNFRKYLIKPFSQQSIKPNSQPSQQSKEKSKTVNSIPSVGFKAPNEEQTNQVEKKTITINSQLLFLHTKAFSQKEPRKKQSWVENHRKNSRNPTLPKVNLMRMNYLQKNHRPVQAKFE